MPRGKDEGVLRFSGHPDDLIWFLEDVQDLCMQASCFEDHEWARWSIFYLGIKEFECPAVCYSKHDLYDLVDKQKKVKINSCKALLNYRLCFTDIAAQLRISNQLSWIEKDDLFLEGFDQEFQGEILQRLKWNNQREYADHPWPTCQVTREAERLLEEGYCFKLREAHLARDQQSAQEAQYEAEMQKSRAARMEEQCRGLEKCSESARLGSKALQSPSSTSFEIQLLTHNSQDSSKLLKAPGEGSRGQAVEIEGIEVAAAELSSSPLVKHRCEPSFDHLQIPPIELRDAEDKLRVDERPIEAEACAPEVLKPIPEPRGDLCEVPEQVGCMEVEEIKSGVEVKRPLKVVTRRKPPEAKIRRKTLKSVTRMIKEILPEFQITHSSSRLSGWTILLIFLQQGWTWSLGVETCMTSPSMLSQPAKQSGATTLRVNDARSLAPHTCSDAAMEIYASLSHKSENYLFEGYEILGGKVKAPHSGYMECYIKFRGYEAGDRAKVKPRAPVGAWDKTRSLLWRVLSVFLEDTLWSALSHWTLTLVQGLVFLCEYLRVSRTPRESEEVAKRSPSLDIQSSKNPSKVKRQEE
ncbi:hypothetical protein EV401DRAFT_1895590 [Pisolithus croceorrhizus]|nr:hypothetical protein EV401DRAFT_1895590 [Pisolithus croceorrhizus]